MSVMTSNTAFGGAGMTVRVVSEKSMDRLCADRRPSWGIRPPEYASDPAAPPCRRRDPRPARRRAEWNVVATTTRSAGGAYA
jgi:hypothetical protein